MALGNLRVVEELAVAGRSDPLITALIEKLPPTGRQWASADRRAWLDLMERAFDVVYGASGGSMTKTSAPAPARRAKQAARKPAKAKPAPKAKAGKPPLVAGPAFFIDRQNYARRAGGDRILPSDVAGILVDKRGMNGDLATIMWADDSVGIPKGLQLDIGIQEGDD